VGGFTGHGSGSDEIARNFKWNLAEWLFDRLFTGGDCRAISVAALGWRPMFWIGALKTALLACI